MSPMKKTLLAAMAGLSLSMMLSVTPITIAHADPILNDTVTIKGIACTALADDSTGSGVGETRCNFPAGFTVPAANRGRVSLTEADGKISDILWTHITATNPHFHYISDISERGIDLTTLKTVFPDLFDDDIHLGDFNTDKGSVAETAGPIDVSAKFGQDAGLVVITSDVPEPATLSLLVVGLAGLLGYRLRQRKL